MIDRQEVIQAYGDRAKNRIISDLGVSQFNERTNKGLCPLHNEKTPSFTYNPKDYTFKCFGCGERFDVISHLTDNMHMSYKQAIVDLCEEIGIDPKVNNIKQSRIDNKKYKKPDGKHSEMTQQIVNHFKDRGIEEETLKHWRVKSGVNSFNIKGKYEKRKCIVFECYDEYDELVHASYRTRDKHFTQSTGTKSIMWGMWHIQPKGTLHITEGQIDAMTLWQCGFKNVVSIPSGASNNKYLEHNFDFLSKFDELVFWIDDDEPGHRAGNIFKSKFQDARIITHDEYKDPNEVFLRLGKDEVVRFLNQPPQLPKGIKTINDLFYSTEEPSEEERIETGFKEFDRHVDDWRLQQLSIVFGRDNEGKSTFMSQVITHQLKKKVKTFLFSAELGDQPIQDWLYRQLIGDGKGCYVKKMGKYKEKYYLKPEVLKAIRKYTKDLLYIVDKTDDEILENNEVLFKNLAKLATKFGVKLFVLDNLQSVMIQKHADVNRDQSHFMEKCRQFAQKYNVHVVVVAHPHKVNELEADENTLVGNLLKDNISGSKDISNKAHNIVSVERNHRELNENHFDMILTNLKDKDEGRRVGFKYKFDATTKCFYSNETPIIENAEFKAMIPKTIKYYNGTEQTFEKQEMGECPF